MPKTNKSSPSSEASPPPAKKLKSDNTSSKNLALPPMKICFDSPPSALKKKKIKKTWGNFLNLHATQDGKYFVVYSTRADNGEGAYLRPMLQAFDTDIQTGGPLRKEWRAISMVNRRGEDGDSDMMKGPNTQYPWEAFVLVPLEEGDSPQFLLDNLAKKLTDFVESCPDYHKNLPFLPLPIDNSDVKPLAHYLKDHDVVALIKRAYPHWKKDDLANHEAIMESFFGSANYGKGVLDGMPQVLFDQI